MSGKKTWKTWGTSPMKDANEDATIKPQVHLPKGFSLVSGGGGWTVQYHATMVHTNDSTMVQPIIDMLQRELTRQATEDFLYL